MATVEEKFAKALEENELLRRDQINTLVAHLAKNGSVKSERVAKAMRMVDRSEFVPSQSRSVAFEDRPVPIGFNVNISAPHMHAYCLNACEAKLVPGACVLDVGSGSGYLLAAMYEMCKDPVNKKAHVIGIEHIEGLVKFSTDNLGKSFKA